MHCYVLSLSSCVVPPLVLRGDLVESAAVKLVEQIEEVLR